MSRPVSRVLMVDEAGLFRMLEASFLRRLGCEIVRAHDGPELIRRARDGAPNCILLDTLNPDLNGPDCVRTLKSDPALSSIPVLVVTSTDEVKACCEAGADATLARPVESGALELALTSLGRGAQREGRRRVVNRWVRVATPEGPRRVRLKDISRSGLFLALQEPWPLQSRIDLSLRLVGSEGAWQVLAQGVVVRQVVRDPDSHLIPGIGVRFVDLNPQDETYIDHYVNQTVFDGETIPDEVPETVQRP